MLLAPGAPGSLTQPEKSSASAAEAVTADADTAQVDTAQADTMFDQPKRS
jgi:hypothetical protein